MVREAFSLCYSPLLTTLQLMNSLDLRLGAPSLYTTQALWATAKGPILPSYRFFLSVQSGIFPP